MSKPIELPANVGGVAAKQLRSFIERIERIKEEIKCLNDDVSDLYQEAKGQGFNPKAMKIIVAKRAKLAKNPEALNELEADIALYEAALGMAGLQMDMFRGEE